MRPRMMVMKMEKKMMNAARSEDCVDRRWLGLVGYVSSILYLMTGSLLRVPAEKYTFFPLKTTYSLSPFQFPLVFAFGPSSSQVLKQRNIGVLPPPNHGPVSK